jgi:hypothetical protein
MSRERSHKLRIRRATSVAPSVAPSANAARRVENVAANAAEGRHPRATTRNDRTAPGRRSSASGPRDGQARRRSGRSGRPVGSVKDADDPVRTAARWPPSGGRWPSRPARLNPPHDQDRWGRSGAPVGDPASREDEAIPRRVDRLPWQQAKRGPLDPRRSEGRCYSRAAMEGRAVGAPPAADLAVELIEAEVVALATCRARWHSKNSGPGLARSDWCGEAP